MKAEIELLCCCYMSRNIAPKQGKCIWSCRFSFPRNGKLGKVHSNLKQSLRLWFSPTVSRSGSVPRPCAGKRHNTPLSKPPPVFALLPYHICIRTLIPSISSVFILKSTPAGKKERAIRLRKPRSPEEPENEHHVHFAPQI